ncbi:MAG: hypothetical protein ABSH44_04975 [Bryobacteraceae bacterium]|jgi:hypothetical protein
MPPIIGLSGRVVNDHVFNSERFSERGGSYWFHGGGRAFQVVPERPLDGNRKVPARFDRSVLQYADYSQFGGGTYNAAAAMAAIAPDIELRYSDSGTPNPALEADLARRGIACRFRGLFPTLDNLVTGDPRAEDKIIFKSQPPPHAIPIPPEDQLAWIKQGGTVFLNSDNHHPWVTRLAGDAARGRLNLHVVLTPSLPGPYLLKAVVPHARLIVAGLDELGAALGVRVRNSVEGGVEALRMLAERAMSPVVHLTLGKDGVLVTDPEDMTARHVRLAPAKHRDVQRHLRDHSKVCGCGDCYAGAVTLYTVAGRSVFGAGPLNDSPFVSAAVAGCGAAVRRLGYTGPLGPDDFVVTEAGYLGAARDGAA